MCEIEIKAHVTDYNAVQKKLNKIALFVYKEKKDDFYYRLLEGTRGVRLRLVTITVDGRTKKEVYFTYKKNETVGTKDHQGLEVNEELEARLDKEDAIKQYLLDTGHTMYLHKQKEGLLYQLNVGVGACNIELCRVANLGFFLEVEIVGFNLDKEICHAKILDIIHKAGLSDTDIEPRYYSDLISNTN